MWVLTDVANTNPPPREPFQPLLVCNFSLQQEENSLLPPVIHLLNFSIPKFMMGGFRIINSYPMGNNFTNKNTVLRMIPFASVLQFPLIPNTI